MKRFSIVDNGYNIEEFDSYIDTSDVDELTLLDKEKNSFKDTALMLDYLEELGVDYVLLLKTKDKLAKHLHIPLQAGSDHVLKLMNRRYNKEEFISII